MSNTIQSIPVKLILPHPGNPRKNLGDLEELTESVRAMGILQNLTVVPRELVPAAADAAGDEKYVTVIGHRRLRAAVLAGLKEVPCTVRDMDYKTQISTMLLENIQRNDLTVYEQAAGFQQLTILGCSVAEISEMSGFSKSSVRRRLEIAKLDQKLLKEISESRQLSLGDFDRLAEIENVNRRNELLKNIGTYNFDSAVRQAVREQHRKKVTPLAKKLLKELGAVAIPEHERYGGKYETVDVIDLDKWDPATGIKNKGRKEEALFYFINNYGDLYLYQKKKNQPKEKKSKEESAREKAFADAHAACKKAESVAYDCRKAFVDGLTVTQKNLPLFLRGAILVITASATLYKGADRDKIIRLYGVDPDGKWDAVRAGTVKKAIENEDPKLIPQVIYTRFCDSSTNGYHTGYSSEWPRHDKNLMLDALYAWLGMLGYEMSDTERELQKGTFEALHRGDKEKGGKKK